MSLDGGEKAPEGNPDDHRSLWIWRRELVLAGGRLLDQRPGIALPAYVGGQESPEENLSGEPLWAIKDVRRLVTGLINREYCGITGNYRWD